MRPEDSALGKKTSYDSHYNPSKLFPLTRIENRQKIAVEGQLPFFGFDIWNHYEFSCLNENGKPIAALVVLIFACESDYIVESKSMKLYLTSFNNTKFKDLSIVKATIQTDLEACLNGSPVKVYITPVHLFSQKIGGTLEGICLDTLNIECSVYHTDPTFLKVGDEIVEETLYSDLLTSRCLITGQPDWCSVQIAYKGHKINHAGLLRYIVSFRNSNEFHEHCIEKIFMHIMQRCSPLELTVYGRSTRRGGIDINSYRSTQPVDSQAIPNVRLCRQ